MGDFWDVSSEMSRRARHGYALGTQWVTRIFFTPISGVISPDLETRRGPSCMGNLMIRSCSPTRCIFWKVNLIFHEHQHVIARVVDGEYPKTNVNIYYMYTTQIKVAIWHRADMLGCVSSVLGSHEGFIIWCN